LEDQLQPLAKRASGCELHSKGLETRTGGGQFDMVAETVVIDALELGIQAFGVNSEASCQNSSDVLASRLDCSLSSPFRLPLLKHR
jgi:hypothetical protein